MPQFGRRLTSAVLSGFLIGSSLIGLAQDDSTPGIVRITDARPQGVPAQTVGFHGHQSSGAYVEMGANCPGDCPSGYGDCPHCRGGYGCKGKHCHLKHLFCEHYGKYSADHGFSLPGKTPIYRRGVQYNAYYPQGWYGTPEGNLTGQVYPTVYMPTDTTQLGYTYQHVPFWMPNPNALPPRPIPAQWHNLVPIAHAPWHGNWGGPYYGGHWHGHRHGINGGDAYCPPAAVNWTQSPTTTPTPSTDGSEPTLQSAPPSSDPPPAPVPDSEPKNNSAQNSQIRRAVMER